MQNIKLILIALILTFFAHLVLPDDYYRGDLMLHIPFIKKQVDSKFFPSDYVLDSSNPQSSTIYYPLGTLFLQLPFSLQSSFRIWWSIGIFFIFLALLTFSFLAHRREIVGIFWILCLMMRVPIGGTAIQTLETSAIPRLFAMAGISWTLVLLYQRRWFWGVILLFLVFLLHPTSALFSCGSLCVYFIFHKKLWRRKGLIQLIITAIVGLVAFGMMLPEMAPEWLTIIRLRNSYGFLDLWSVSSWGLLLLGILPGVLYAISKTKTKSVFASQLFAVTLFFACVCTLLQLLFAQIHPLPQAVALQLGRSWWWVITISLYCLSLKLAQNKNYTKTIFILLVVIVLSRNVLASKRIIDPDWLTAQGWARTHTERRCIFLVPFNSVGFRIGSERTTTGEYKDGALSFYSDTFAKEWNTRKLELNSWQDFSDEKLRELQNKYQFDFIVDSKEKKERKLPISYENKQVRVYQITDSCPMSL